MTKRPHVELVQRVFPNEVHDLYLTFEDTIDTYNMGAQFMLDHLQGRAVVEAPPLPVAGHGAADAGAERCTPGTGFGAFTPGVAREYSANVRAATVTSSAGDAALSVTDPEQPGARASGQRRRDARAAADPARGRRRVRAALERPAAAAVLHGTGERRRRDARLPSEASPATEPLRTGTYAKTLTFTLSTTNP